MVRARRAGWLFLVHLFFWVIAGGAVAWGEPTPAGEIIYLQGEVSIRRSGTLAWVPAQSQRELFPGDAIKTGNASKAAILCVDESQIKLNENTILVLKSVAPSPRLGKVAPAALEKTPGSIYQVIQGEIWLRNKNEKFRFELETPAVTANIRGTEFNIRVKPDGTTQVTLLEGSLCMINPAGELCLRPGEEGYAIPGQAPTKRVLVQPADAVQWSLYYPGIISYRDLPLAALPGEARIPPGAPAVAPLVEQGEVAYDQGRLDKAQTEAESALKLEPNNGRALTLLGWVYLQRQEPVKAQGFLARVRQLDDRAIIGLALARYRQGDIVGAYEFIKFAGEKIRPTPLLLTMAGYFALLVGRVDEARSHLGAAVKAPAPAGMLAQAFLAQIEIVQNRKQEALADASQALSLSPDSPMALLSMALVKIAYFDLPAARQFLEKALAADPRFVDAYVYLAKIWLGSDYLGRAQKTIDQALRLTPGDGVVLSLAGFIRLAYRDYSEAHDLFVRAIITDPRLGEPHLGLAIYSFRYRQSQEGLSEMLTATLLDPRVSLYQSELGKALYQVRAFDKALEVYDYAGKLDPKDPTPHFYKGIALSDLNRPGEAIQAINHSIALNDNVAVFKSRLMLDRDRSVRNYNLARAYNQLGLGEWAYSKAVTAVNHDPTNSSAHLFLSKSFGGSEFLAADQEMLLFRVLSPANQNTFMNLLENDYTPMFEMPYNRATLQGGIGAWEGKKPIQNHLVNLYGGLPGAAYYLLENYIEDRGFRVRNSDLRHTDSQAAFKWEPTVNGCLTGLFQYWDEKQGDTANLNDFKYQNDPFSRYHDRFRFFELSYVHRFTPRATFIAYGAYQTWKNHQIWPSSSTVVDPDTGDITVDKMRDIQKFDFEYHNVQLQQQLVLGNHSLIGGFDYFAGHVNYQQWLSEDISFNGEPFFNGLTYQDNNKPPIRSNSFYLLDYWRLSRQLLVELGVFKDFAKVSRVGLPQPLTNSLWSPRLGLNYQINEQHTLRLALARVMNPHIFLNSLLVPAEIASFPWVFISSRGALVRMAGAAWEAQWNPKTFTVLRLSAHRVDTPDWDFDGNRIWWGLKRYQASLILNRILYPSLGLSMGASVKRIAPDPNPYITQALGLQELPDITEVNASLGLAYLHSSGWQGGIRTFLVQQRLKHRNENLFSLVNLRVGKEFTNKRGLATIELDNLLNRHFFYALEPLRDPEFFPVRRIMFKLALYF
jgi:tetratricopeptide (TPR) repeat protein